METLRDVCRSDARFFISASGVDSELGEGYAGASVDVEERMTPVAPDMAAKHGVHDEMDSSINLSF